MPEYQIVNGTSYHVETPPAVIEVLERARQGRNRILVSYGDAATGKDWLEEFDIAGYVAFGKVLAVASTTSTRPTTLAPWLFDRKPNPSRSPMAAP